ncbi:MAG: hypothetical protein M3270_09905, partial [Thermoproteota archaeon]|nr:hypothetical protein [Thermoproteota archaeon]
LIDYKLLSSSVYFVNVNNNNNNWLCSTIEEDFFSFPSRINCACLSLSLIMDRMRIDKLFTVI